MQFFTYVCIVGSYRLSVCRFHADVPAGNMQLVLFRRQVCLRKVAF